ncbi:hypothetical protein E4T39_05751 [Aureobasidium subglaciale]|nr:hypothetical protein E4T39_05751 [Aureobasidium subglaciale]
MPDRELPVDTLLTIMICLVWPPGAVYIMKGCGSEVAICAGLTMLFIFPGVWYAVHTAVHRPKNAQSKVIVDNNGTASNVQTTPRRTNTLPPVVQTIQAQPAATPTEQVVVVTKGPEPASATSSPTASVAPLR